MTTRFKEAMSRVATGVSILTCADNSQYYGMTISSLSSVGLNPPTVSVCVDGASTMLDAFRRARCFGLTVLSEKQKHIGMTFANSQIPYAKRFDGVDFEVINGCPLIRGGLSNLTCEIVGEHAISENVVLFGRVTHVESHDGKPLIYFLRDWRKLGQA